MFILYAVAHFHKSVKYTNYLFFLFFFQYFSQFYCLSIGAKQFGAVLGEVVLEGNIVVFDRANHRVGFASSNLTDPENGATCGKVSIIFCFCNVYL